MRFLLLLCSLVGSSLLCAAADLTPGQQIVLWPDGAPGAIANPTPEVLNQPDQTRNFARITNVHQPSLLAYLPPKEKANGMAIVIAPGGGHMFLTIGKEGYDVAEWCNQRGIAAFILKYRLAREPGSKYTVEGHALPDSQRALRLVRSHAAEWGLNPDKIGFLGFSAGGELAALVETRFDRGHPQASDPIQRISSRPDFAVVVYPGFPAGEVTVPADAPPTFLICADDDRSHVVTTANLYLDLQKQKIPSEMHIYAAGGHGFGLYNKHAPINTWTDRLFDWMHDQKLLTTR